MSIAAGSEPRITALEVTEDAIAAQLADGRTISVPLAWSWRLADASPAQRANFAARFAADPGPIQLGPGEVDPGSAKWIPGLRRSIPNDADASLADAAASRQGW